MCNMYVPSNFRVNQRRALNNEAQLQRIRLNEGTIKY